MTHLASIGAGVFSDLAIAITTTYAAPVADDLTEFNALFATEAAPGASGTFTRVKNVREFPALGTPANIVNVPTYGQSTSQQVQGQSDAPNLEITLNYVASEWADGTTLGALVGNGKQYAFRFALLNAKPPGYSSTAGASGLGGTTAAPVENTLWYFIGKVEALLVTPQLTDANQATLTLSLQSKFYGAYTIAAA